MGSALLRGNLKVCFIHITHIFQDIHKHYFVTPIFRLIRINQKNSGVCGMVVLYYQKRETS